MSKRSAAAQKQAATRAKATATAKRSTTTQNKATARQKATATPAPPARRPRARQVATTTTRATKAAVTSAKKGSAAKAAATSRAPAKARTATRRTMTTAASKASTPSRPATVADVYQYILDQHPDHVAADEALRRHLDLDHFVFLSTRLQLSLEDLSMYVLVFYLECPRQPSLLIFESKFCSGLERALATARRNNNNSGRGTAAAAAALPLRADDGYAAAFAALRSAVDAMNEQLWRDAALRQRFYVFIYCWAMQSMDEAERLPRAVEVWQMFFRTEASAPARTASAHPFTGYCHFARLPEWLTFVQSPAFAHLHVSYDLWQQMLPFAQLTSYDKYSCEDAWPVALDEFVAWFASQKSKATTSKATTSKAASKTSK